MIGKFICQKKKKKKLNDVYVTKIFVFILDWNKDFKPAKFPETKKERDASAEKYNLLPEEYKTYADDGMGYGDYPKLPDVGVEQRDPYYPYDFPEHRRNFNEPVSGFCSELIRGFFFKLFYFRFTLTLICTMRTDTVLLKSLVTKLNISG